MKNKIRQFTVRLTVLAMVFSSFAGPVVPFALASGSVAWTPGGVNVTSVEDTLVRAGAQTNGMLAADGSGGAWHVFEDGISGDILLQHYDSSGNRLLGPTGSTVVNATGTQSTPRIVADGSGGAIVAWNDPRSGNYDVYVQRFNSSGVAQWTANGVAVSSGSNQQRMTGTLSSGREASPLAADGSGNAYVVWQEDFSAAPIKAQKLNSSGVAQWTAGGVTVTSTNGEEPSLIHDGSGGAMVAWKDRRNASASGEIYAQRMNSSGSAVAAANGVFLMGVNTKYHGSLHLVTDGSGGAIVLAESDRVSNQNTIVVQRVNASVAAQWTANGVVIATGPSFQADMIPDGSGGAVLAWGDNRNFGTASNDVFAQRIDSSGAKQWGANDLRVTSDSVAEGNPLLAADGSGNYVVYWDDDANGLMTSIYAQKYDGSGVAQWTAGGVSQIAGSPSNNFNVRNLVSDGTSTFVAAQRVYVGLSDSDVYAQKTNASGAPQWGSAGARAQTIGGTVDQDEPFIVADGSGSYFVSWRDYRDGSSATNVYAQKLNAAGAKMWGNGIEVAGVSGEDEAPYGMLADGAGGVIIVWWNYDTDVLRAQRLDADGSVHSGWPAAGVVFAPDGGPEFMGIVTDGANGAIVGFFGDNYEEIRMNRISGSGTLPWGASGVVVSDPANDCGVDISVSTMMASDGAGGAYITWEQETAASFCSTRQLLFSRIDGNGSLHSGWTANGNVATSDATATQPSAWADGSGGLLLAWKVNANAGDIKVQKFNGSAVAQWTANGVSFVTDSDQQYNPNVISDGAGGAIAVWTDGRTGSFHIFAQRADSAGALQWTANGVAVGGQIQDYINVMPDGSGGAVMAWGTFGTVYIDIYGQRISSSGTVKWGSGGMPIADLDEEERFTVNTNRVDLQKVAPDGNGGLVTVYELSLDDGSLTDVRAQRVLDSEGDATPPNISGISAGSITGTGATISWTTNESADSTVNYGLTAGYGSTAADATYVTSHGVPLSGLSPSTLYHYQVCSKDAALNQSCSSDQTFSTTGGGSNSPTLSNSITLSRLRAGVSSNVTVRFTLQNTLSGTLTVTFPAGFTVTAAATGPESSGCLSGFGFTSTTLTATKTNCSGTIVLGGATVTNPVTPGVYHVGWVNDDPGGGDIVIVDSDQVTVTGAVAPSISFNVGSQAAIVTCDGTFSGNGGTVGLGALTTGSVSTSDAGGVPHICTRVSTNAASGAVVTVLSANASLRSTSVPADAIPSSTATLVAGTSGYGLCAGSGGSDSGRDTTTPAGAVAASAAPFNGSCSTSGHAVGGLTTSPQTVWSISGPSQNAFFRLYVKAAIAPTVPAHSDYTDTLTFIATGTY